MRALCFSTTRSGFSTLGLIAPLFYGDIRWTVPKVSKSLKKGAGTRKTPLDGILQVGA